MTFTNIFGGTTVYPAEVNYRALALSANVTLEWPTEVSSTSNILASIMDVTPSGAGFTVRLPAANLASVGETALFFNVGASAFTVADNGGNTVVSVAPGLAWQVYLTNNGSANGTWRSTQYGAGTSSATAGSLVGAGIKAIGTTLNQSMDSTSLNSNYTVNVNDRADVFNWVGGAGIITIPSAATLGNDWFFHVRNSGTGAVTLQTSVGGQFINGATTLILNPGDSAVVFCDGSNFFTIGLGKSAAFAFDFVSIDLTGQASPLTLTGANLNRVAYRFTGTITGNFQVIVPSTVQQYWVSNETTVASDPYTIEIKTLSGLGVSLARNQRAILYSDGTNVIDADTAGISLPLSVSQGGTGSTTAGGALVNLGGTSLGISLFTAATASAGRNALGATVAGDAAFTAASSTGTGALVFATSPALVTPTLGVASATSIATGLGTAAAPAYIFTGDTNTGMWSPAADTIAFSEGGVEAMRITSTGDVGIGTTTPSSKLAVYGGASGTDTRVTIGNAASAIQVGVGSANETFLSGNAAFPMLLYTNGTERMRITSTGDVGIGTSAPGSLLQLNRDSGAADLRLSVAGTLHGNIYASISDMDIFAVTAIPLIFGTTNTERMRISAAGDVGIGTVSPGARVDIVGPTLTAATASTYALWIANTGGANGDLAFGSNATAAYAQSWGGKPLAINSQGNNVGIGTASPGAKLDVSGTVNFSGALTSGNLADAAGYKGLPQNSQTASYTLAFSDMGKTIYLSGTTAAQSVTIPPNSGGGSVAFPIGTVIRVVNDSNQNWTIPITTDTLIWSPSGGSGTRTIASRGAATIEKMTATRWWITGVGLT